MMRAETFTKIRPIFGGSLSQSQVDGIETIAGAWAKYGDGDNRKLAYLLSTAHHETGAAMEPNRENMNYTANGLLKTFSRERISAADARKYGRTSSKPADQRAIANAVYGGAWGRENLGNTQPNDGWDFRGGGQSHTTGRTNYERVKKATGVDVVSNSDLILDPQVSAIALVVASMEGWYTGKKLGDYITPQKADYVNARRVINGTDKAEAIAAVARKFEAALGTEAVKPYPQPLPPDVPKLPPVVTPARSNWLVDLIAAILSIFKRR